MLFGAAQAVVLSSFVAYGLPTHGEENETAKPETTPAAEAPAADSALPAEVDLRPTFRELQLPPRPQGRRGTCSVFTTAGAFEFALAKQSGAGKPLSVEYLNWACNQLTHNRRDTGQFFHNLLKGYEEHGICFESEMPYRSRFSPRVNPDEEAIESAHRVRDNKFGVHWIKPIGGKPGFTDEQMIEVKRILASGYPIAAGASHSRLLVGYVDKSEAAGGGIFYTKDSGSGSFSEVTYEFAKAEINDAFWVELSEAAVEAAPKTE